MTSKMFLASVMFLLIIFLRICSFVKGDDFAEGGGSAYFEGSSEVNESGKASDCGLSSLEAAESSVTLQSPNFPQDYPPNSECWWTIIAPAGYHVQLILIRFKLENCCDKLEVYDASSQVDAIEPYATISLKDSTKWLQSNNNYVTLKFTSDHSVQNFGFVLSYQSIAIHCPSLQTPNYGTKVCYIGTKFISNCRFSCKFGITLSGSELRSCLSNGSWTGKPVTCNPVCPELADPGNGYLSCTNGNKIGSKCHYVCDDGYKLSGNENLTCSDDTSWSDWEPTCYTCGLSNLEASVESSSSLQSPIVHQTYQQYSECWWTITAPVGYHVQIAFNTFDLHQSLYQLQLYEVPSQPAAGQPYTSISPADTWSAIPVSNVNYITLHFTATTSLTEKRFELTYKAIAFTCATLPPLVNGRNICYAGVDRTAHCKFSCKEGFKISGSERRSCQSNGSWTGSHVFCDKITSCRDLLVPKNGGVNCTDAFQVGSECRFWCEDDYSLYGSESQTCTLLGSWSGSAVACVTCGSSNLNASTERPASLQSPNYPKKYLPDTECWWTITAPHGYHVQIVIIDFELERYVSHLQLYDAPSQATAKEPFADILAVHARKGIPISNGSFVTLKFTAGWAERKGFRLSYEAIKITCSPLPVVKDGFQFCYTHKNRTPYCSFSCKDGFQLSSNERRSCQLNGSWIGSPVTCDKTTSCPELLHPKNGEIRCTNGTSFGSKCQFWCEDGYKVVGVESLTCEESGSWSDVEATCRRSTSAYASTCSIIHQLICDGSYNCLDQSDEKGCSCPNRKFECDCYGTGCPSRKGCITQSLVCDGINHCGDWSDERNCQCSDTRFQCTDGTCIDRSKVNDGSTDCVNVDDEFNCNMTQGRVKCGCLHHDDQCTSSGRCIPSNWVGDTTNDCHDHSDEPCNASKVWCSECWVIINRCSTNESKSILMKNSEKNATKCHRVTIPSDKNQKLKSSWVCMTSPCGKCLSSFQCQSGQIIENGYFCDTVRQCNDGSDEDMNVFGFRCAGKSRRRDCVLPQKNVYDSVAQCADSSDLCFVNGEFRCFQCLDGKLIVSAKQVCDGMIDCYDMSDECLCANQSVCNAVLGEEMSRCLPSEMHCYNKTNCVEMDKVMCNATAECQNDNLQKFCHQNHQSSGTISCFGKTPKSPNLAIIATRCDGRLECSEMEDECDCQPRPAFCDGCATTSIRHGNIYDVCDGYINGLCQYEIEKNCPMRFYCKSNDKISIDIRSVCDGIFDCDDHSDEDNPTCRTKRFYCTKGNAFSINKDYVCDGIKDCDNGEDETRELCGNERFYCESGEPISVNTKLLENGYNDCADGSDECISLFSDRYEMIANPILRALFWIMGFLALIGNLTISLYTAKDMLSCKKTNVIKLANNIFVWNLTISDFLMGIYLIGVVAQGVRYSGSYCFVDKQWRSSNLCSGLGTLAVLSSETSVLIMAAMSTFRLVTVYKPFLSSSINIKWIVIACCSCWIVSIFLAALPWIPFQSGYFISDVWFPNTVLKTNTVSKLDMFILAKRIIANNSHIDSWYEVKKIISDAFPYNPINGEFGYYSEISVCMPRFYASSNEAAWQYSIFLITLNFLLFIYMVVVYILVYKKATGMKQSRSTKKDPNKGMQKRISRLLLTDFCCWIPVCMMGCLSILGVPLNPKAYMVSAGFLLPINSAMNPILYSKFVDHHTSRAKRKIIKIFSDTFLPKTGRTVVVAKTEAVEFRVVEV